MMGKKESIIIVPTTTESVLHIFMVLHPWIQSTAHREQSHCWETVDRRANWVHHCINIRVLSTCGYWHVILELVACRYWGTVGSQVTCIFLTVQASTPNSALCSGQWYVERMWKIEVHGWWALENMQTHVIEQGAGRGRCQRQRVYKVVK